MTDYFDFARTNTNAIISKLNGIDFNDEQCNKLSEFCTKLKLHRHDDMTKWIYQDLLDDPDAVTDFLKLNDN